MQVADRMEYDLGNVCDFLACRPIDDLDEALAWPLDDDAKKSARRQHRVQRLQKQQHQQQQASDETSRRAAKLLVCHDMRNNYTEDKYFQGFVSSSSSSSACHMFSLYHWSLVDAFVYFSHHLITIPPESWTNAAHENHTPILGTFITEFDAGESICARLLADASRVDTLVAAMCDMARWHGFDGWLLNIENRVSVEHTANLRYFVSALTERMRAHNGMVVWYDSVIETGELAWQNELNAHNAAYFERASSLFLNYTWSEANLAASKRSVLEERRPLDDVLVGVDCFGRGCVGDGGFACDRAFAMIAAHEMSVALFAPGWLHECNEPSALIANRYTINFCSISKTNSLYLYHLCTGM